MSFIRGFEKVAVTDLPQEALVMADAPMQTYVPGSRLDKETAQARGRATRTGVRNEDREFRKEDHHDWKNSRQP